MALSTQLSVKKLVKAATRFISKDLSEFTQVISKLEREYSDSGEASAVCQELTSKLRAEAMQILSATAKKMASIASGKRRSKEEQTRMKLAMQRLEKTFGMPVKRIQSSRLSTSAICELSADCEMLLFSPKSRRSESGRYEFFYCNPH